MSKCDLTDSEARARPARSLMKAFTFMSNGDEIHLTLSANQGIGAAFAQQLAAKSMAVVVGARKRKNVSETVEAVQNEGGEATVVPLDITNQLSITKVIKSICVT